MDLSSINWFAVVACVIVSFIVGFGWYHEKAFFLAWWKGIGKSGKPGTEGMGLTWGLTTVASIVQAVAMAFMVNAVGGLMTGGPSLASGALVGFMLWLGFVASTSLSNKLFAQQGFKVWAIEAGNHLVNFVLFGAILGAWR
jgi:hypothetical protein